MNTFRFRFQQRNVGDWENPLIVHWKFISQEFTRAHKQARMDSQDYMWNSDPGLINVSGEGNPIA